MKGWRIIVASPKSQSIQQRGPSVTSLLKRLGMTPRKSLGQHFLVSPGVVDKVLSASPVTKRDVVVEIGPGLGALTGGLAEKAGFVLALELDNNLANALSTSFRSQTNIRIVNGDALKVDLETLVDKNLEYHVVANLPYYVATAVIRRFLEATHKPKSLVVTVQREVAKNMVAAPGNLNLLAIGVQCYGTPRIVAFVQPGSFYPRPNVTSAIVRVDVYDRPWVEIQNQANFFKLVKAGFKARRKQLRGGLARALSISSVEVDAVLTHVGIGGDKRAEDLSIPEWVTFFHAVTEAGWKL